MGLYVNPKDGTSKEEFLKNHGTQILLDDALHWDFSQNNKVLMCLVDNGPFTALAVAYCDAERDEFTQRKDPRPRTYYSVPRDSITPENSGISEESLNRYVPI